MASARRKNAPFAVPITWTEMETIDAPNHFRIGDAAGLVKRAASKALSGWGRADQTLPTCDRTERALTIDGASVDEFIGAGISALVERMPPREGHMPA